MNEVDVSSDNSADIAEKFKDLSNEEIRLGIAQLNAEQLASVISYMNEKNTPYWKGKTRAIILGLSNQKQLEIAGKALSVPQILDFFESNLLVQEDNFNKLLAIMVGMSHQTFAELLGEISDYQLQVLLQMSFSEPLQHQLSVFCHEMENKYSSFTDELNKLRIDIETLPMENLSRRDLSDVKSRINSIALEFTNGLEKMKNALRIAWNTHRSDLIENLNSLKDKYLHTLNNFIGFTESPQGVTGLYEMLQERLDTVFGNPYDLKDSESLSNGEPCIDALIKFSIWYLKDYWEIGLLPKIHSEQELELDPSSHTEQARLEHRDKLFSEVQENLAKLQLTTVWELKSANIYSREALKEYIREHSELLVD